MTEETCICGHPRHEHISSIGSCVYADHRAEFTMCPCTSYTPDIPACNTPIKITQGITTNTNRPAPDQVGPHGINQAGDVGPLRKQVEHLQKACHIFEENSENVAQIWSLLLTLYEKVKDQELTKELHNQIKVVLYTKSAPPDFEVLDRLQHENKVFRAIARKCADMISDFSRVGPITVAKEQAQKFVDQINEHLAAGS